MKKAFTMFALLLFSITAFAITGKDDWETIRKSRAVLIVQPAFAERFGKDGLFNSCVSGNEIRSITPVKNCVAYTQVDNENQNQNLSGYKNYNCTQYRKEHVSMNRLHTKEHCVRFAPINEYTSGECEAYEPSSAVYPTSYRLPVIEAEGDEYGTHLFSKTYALPECD